MQEPRRNWTSMARARWRFAAARPALRALLLGGVLAAGLLAQTPETAAAESSIGSRVAGLRDARAALGRWMETQQIITRERKEWQQGREILASRVDLVKQEATALQERLQQAAAAAEQAAQRKAVLSGDNDKLKTSAATLATTVSAMETGVRKLLPRLPEPVQARLKPLTERIPADGAATRVSVAERFQNVLGIMNDLNKANTEINVHFEVRTLADGKPSEVRVLYVGLAQAWYLSAKGDAGVGRPGPNGWVWENAPALADKLALALDIIQGKQSPAFVPLPVKIQ